ncbi:MAG TPA: HAMP domain-containing sensor histidine kinase [Ktedonobacterales bacterium]
MSVTSSVTDLERAEYLTYESQRRQRLLGTVAPAGVALTGIACLVATITLLLNPQQDITVRVNDAITFLLAVLYGLGWLLLRRNRLMLSTALVIGASGCGIVVTVAIPCLTQGMSPLSFVQLASLGTVVVLVGMLGNVATIAISTLLLNVVTLAILLLAPHPAVLDGFIRSQLPLLVSVSLTYQWAVAAAMIGIWLTYRTTLKNLGLAYARAQQLDTLKAQFITHINHELRTPIMTVQGYIDYLRLAETSLSQDEIKEMLDKASVTADTLVTLLTNILDIRRIESNEIVNLNPVRVREALDGALTLIDPRMSDGTVRDLRLSLPDELVVWGDHVRVQQILTNLLSNALKYSAPGSPIEIRGRIVRAALPVFALGRRSEQVSPQVVEITVRDYGYGIPPDQIHLLFNRFARLPRDLGSKVVGTGLGLYLCKAFSESMGGRIRAESTGVPGEGTRFVVELPAPPDFVRVVEDKRVVQPSDAV